MISALFFLQSQSFRNRLRAWLGRLKRPKYLIGGLAALLYFGSTFLVMLFAPSAHANGGGPIGLGVDIGAFLLFIMLVLSSWLLPNERSALYFTDAEVAFLFPAPITRRGLIHYKLIRSQTAILFQTVILTLLTGRWRFASHIYIAIIGWWIILSTINLHRIAASFARSMLFDRGLTSTRLRLLVGALLVAAVGVVYYWGRSTMPSWKSAHVDAPNDAPAFFGFLLTLKKWLPQVLSTGPAYYILMPFRWVVAPYYAADASAFGLALVPALLIVVLHYYVVTRADVAFEEASVEYSQKISARLAAMRQRQASGSLVTPKKAKRAPFRLSPVGPAPVGFLWKNLILAGNYFTYRMLLMLVWLSFVFSIIGSENPEKSGSTTHIVVGGFLLWLVMMSVFIGSSLLRADFRADLVSVDLLKIYPLAGWKIVLGEILAPVVVLAAIQWVLLVPAAFLIVPSGAEFAPGLQAIRTACLAGALVLMPAIDLITVLISNGGALLMPGWVRLGKAGVNWFENFGQIFIMNIGQMLVLGLAMLPAGLVFFIVFAILNALIGLPIAVVAGAVLATLVLVAEAVAVIYFLGGVFERFDLSAEPAS